MTDRNTVPYTAPDHECRLFEALVAFEDALWRLPRRRRPRRALRWTPVGGADSLATCSISGRGPLHSITSSLY